VTLRTSRPELNRRYFIKANDEAINFLNLSNPSLPTDIGNLLLRAIEEHPYYFPPPPARRRNHNELEAWRVSSSACLGVRGCFQLQRCSLKRLLITKNVRSRIEASAPQTLEVGATESPQNAAAGRHAMTPRSAVPTARAIRDRSC